MWWRRDTGRARCAAVRHRLAGRSRWLERLHVVLLWRFERCRRKPLADRDQPERQQLVRAPGIFASWNHRGSFTLFWYGFFSRFSRASCLTIEGPVSATGQSSGWGVGAVTVNEGGVGNQPVLCEVVAE